MELTLFDKTGMPIAYLAPEEENSIYLWKGKAVCYLVEDKVYGWRGRHIGWFVNGIIYDIYGRRVGFTRDTCPAPTKLEPVKHIKQIRYIRYIRNIPYVRPLFQKTCSNMSLEEFLTQNMI